MELYTSNNCPNCKALKAQLAEHGIGYVEINISEEGNVIKALMRQIASVPTVIIGEETVYNPSIDDVLRLMEDGEV
jgi:glutaredoxin